MHTVIDPAILYFGTPVVLVSSINPDGSPNLAPMSSAWWLGRSCMLGFGARSQTPANILRTRECVLSLPSVEQVAAVDHELSAVLRARGNGTFVEAGGDPGGCVPSRSCSRGRGLNGLKHLHRS
jgi:flavin reductase (DIM6/NTAB) family NADH-FMN oxidoreductase RutF